MCCEETRFIGHCVSVKVLPTEQHDDRISLGRYETQEEDIAAPTVVTLQDSLTQGSIFVKCHLFAFGSYQMVYYVATSQTLRMVTKGVFPDFCHTMESLISNTLKVM